MNRKPIRSRVSDVAWNRFLGDALTLTWRRYDLLLRRCRKDVSPKVAHALRTEARRLLAEITLAGAVSGDDTLKLAKGLKRNVHVAAEVRDVDVELQCLGPWLKTHPELKPFCRHVRRRRMRATRRTRKKLKRRRLERRLAPLLRHLETRNHREDAGAVVMRVLFDAETNAAKSAAASRRRTSELHRARLAVKKLRYTVECLEPALTADTRAWCVALRRHQSLMGEIHDLEVLCADLQKYAASRPRRQRAFSSVQKHLTRTLRQLVLRYRDEPFPRPPRALVKLQTNANF